MENEPEHVELDDDRCPLCGECLEDDERRWPVCRCCDERLDRELAAYLDFVAVCRGSA